MSTILEFAIFPTDKGVSVSHYVSKVIEMIRKTGFPYQLTSMGTLVETDTVNEALTVLQQAHEILLEHSERVYCTAKFDTQKNKTKRIKSKIESIETKIGEVEK